jgi:hypothetical protein
MASLPTIVSQIPNDLRRFLDRLREIVDKGDLVTRAELVSAGIAERTGSGDLTAANSTQAVTPPAPTNLKTAGAMTSILMSWDAPNYGGHAYTEVWRSTSNVLGTAVLIGQAPGHLFPDSVGSEYEGYYWVRFVSISNTPGSFSGTAGVKGTTAPDATYLIKQLAKAIGESELATNLNTRINLIDADVSVVGSVAAKVKIETDIRIAETRALATGLLNEAAIRGTAISAEETARITADAATASQLSTVSATLNTATAALASETLARVGNDEALARERNILAVQMHGGYTGTDLGEVTTGLLAAEKSARISGLAGVVTQISQLAVGTAQGLDPIKTWYFEPGLEGWSGLGATVAVTNGWLTETAVVAATPAFVSPIFDGFAGAKYNTVRLRIRRVTAGGIWSMASRFVAGGIEYTGPSAVEPVFSSGMATVDFDLSATPSWSGAASITQIKIYLGGAVSDRYDIDFVSIGRIGPAAATAAVQAEETARATADTALATRAAILEATVNSATDGNVALKARVASEETARATADTALASSITALQANVATNQATVVNNYATRAYADTVVASASLTLSSSIGQNTAALQVQGQAINGIGALHSVKIDNNGVMSGYALSSELAAGEVPTSKFLVSVNQFAIIAPGQAVGSPRSVPIAVLTEAQTINGVAFSPGVYIDGASINKGTITEAQIGSLNVDNLAVTGKLKADVMSANVVGAILASAERIDAGHVGTGTLEATTEIRAGGNLLISGEGWIESYADTGYSRGGDYSRFDAGNLKLYRKTVDGVVLYNYLSRAENGVATNGDSVAIPGYWKRQPKVIVTPNILQLYKAAFANQDQAISCRVADLTEVPVASGKWRFKPTAELVLSAYSSATIIGGAPTASSGNVTSAVLMTLANCASISPSVSLLSVHGNGASQYYYRKMKWRVEYSPNNSTWTQGALREVVIGASTSAAVTDVVTITFPTAGVWYWRIYAESIDADGSVFGSLAYDYAETQTALVTTTSYLTYVAANQDQANMTLPAYTPPSGWSVYEVTKTYKLAYSIYCSKANFGQSPPGYSIAGGGFNTIMVAGPWSGSQDYALMSSSTNPWLITNQVDNSWPSHFINLTYQETTYTPLIRITGTNMGGSGQAQIKDGTALIKIRKLKNDTQVTNQLTVNSYNYNLSAATVLAQGSVNWMATGD